VFLPLVAVFIGPSANKHTLDRHRLNGFVRGSVHLVRIQMSKSSCVSIGLKYLGFVLKISVDVNSLFLNLKLRIWVILIYALQRRLLYAKRCAL